MLRLPRKLHCLGVWKISHPVGLATLARAIWARRLHVIECQASVRIHHSIILLDDPRIRHVIAMQH